ncbi:hypothetical protein LXA43DRAFT_887087 [Ganoderma leucocontextum]|nr:hypothetical protein LXA43DRAFT_887087 [Ganoderma leucocontextum]
MVKIQEIYRISVRDQRFLLVPRPARPYHPPSQSPLDSEVSSDPLPNGSGPVQDISTPRTSPTRRSIWDPDSGLSEKIRRACEIARRDGYRYIWIDSSCIDKASSSELSEAINSMFNWYGNAQVCYAFLSDVPPNEDVRAEGSKFRGSRWFTRAWTLQELIAPRVVVFLSHDWEVLGTKDTLTDLIQEITHVDRGILTHGKALADESVAERMRWASRREATRVEDEAYSLLGIFGITMPTLYGEGQYAFRRLQEEILQRIPDQSLLAWGSVCLPIFQEPGQIKISPCASQTPFAPSPRSFDLSHGHIVCAFGPRFESLKLPLEEYTSTPYGIRTQLCFLPLQALNPELTVIGLDGVDTWYLAILGSQHTDDRERLLCRLCYVTRPKSDVEFLHIPDEILAPGSHYLDTVIFTVSLDDLERTTNTLSDRHPITARMSSRTTSAQLQTRTIYLPHPKPSTTEWRLDQDHTVLKLTLSTWARAALRAHGYTVLDIHPTEHPPDYHSLTLFNGSSGMHIQYRHMLIHPPSSELVVAARVSLESSSVLGNGSEVVSWTDWTGRTHPWRWTQEQRRVSLTTPTGDSLTLRLGLDLAWRSEYYLLVNIEHGGVSSGFRGEPMLVAMRCRTCWTNPTAASP